MVKLIVTFDDPTTYHLYYGDEIRRPGTILIFFPWPDAPKGYRGTGQAITTCFFNTPNSIDFERDRLKNNDINFEETCKTI